MEIVRHRREKPTAGRTGLCARRSGGRRRQSVHAACRDTGSAQACHSCFSQNRDKPSLGSWNHRECQSARENSIPLCGEAVGSRTARCWARGPADQSRDPRSETTRMCSVSLWQRSQNRQGGNNRLFSERSSENCTVPFRRMKLDRGTAHERKPEADKDLNGRPETVKLLEEDAGGELLDGVLGGFLGLTPKAGTESDNGHVGPRPIKTRTAKTPPGTGGAAGGAGGDGHCPRGASSGANTPDLAGPGSAFLQRRVHCP